nr:integrase, catalytic region, zinc finger, CCHC-type, peptidase aspartic, catalytic [Tanacetum cinerariifolium]
MELAVEQHCVEKTKIQTKMEKVLHENDRLLTQALSVEIVNIVVHDYVNFDCLNVDACAYCRDIVSSPESALTFAELFEINDLKAQVQEKDTVILKLKEKLKSISGDAQERKIEREVEEIETLNLELDHKVTKLAAKNEHLKQTYKQLFDSIKSLRVQSKEHCDDLFNKVNLKSVKVSVLNASLQEKVWVIIALKEQLNKLKDKVVLTGAVSLNPIDPALLQVDVAPLVPKLRKNRTAHTDYVRVKFGNDHVAKIMGYRDYQIGNVTISRVYYVEGLGHNLFSIGQFCDSDLEVAFRQHTFFIHNLEGVDLLTGSRGNNLYTLSLQDMMA